MDLKTIHASEFGFEDIFYAIKKFTILFNGKMISIKGVTKTKSMIKVYQYQVTSIRPNYYTKLDTDNSALDFGPNEAVKDAFFDSSWLIDTDRDMLVKRWYDHMHITVNKVVDELDNIKKMKDTFNNSLEIKASIDMRPEIWI